MAYNHFAYVPSSVTDDRSGFKFDKPQSKAIQLGWLYPMCAPVRMLPGSTLQINELGMEIRSLPLIAPLMDELVVDVFAFNVPNRIVWEHWKQFLGAVDDVLFDNLTEYQIPHFKYGLQMLADDGTYTSAWSETNPGSPGSISGLNYQWNQTLACHYELPIPWKTTEGDFTTNEYVEISALPFRGYDFIVNEYFLPEFCSDRILFSKTDNGWSGDNTTIILKATNNPWQRFNAVVTPYPSSIGADAVTIGGCVYPVSRAHRSLWLSCLPKPSLETLNLLGTVDSVPIGVVATATGSNPATTFYSGLASGNSFNQGDFVELKGIGSNPITGLTGNDVVAKVNEAVLTVNNYRETILLQNYYDCLNRAGSRYDEIIANLFHTRTSMAVIDIPELIVHKRFTIYRKEVVATAQTDSSKGEVTKPLGSQASYIDTVIRDTFFIKSTTEHGYIHMLYCVRPAFIRMTSGFEPDWTQLNKLDSFYPQFQGMGDVPRKKMEVAYGFEDGLSLDDKEAILGYQEYSADWKYTRASAVGWMDPHTPNYLRGFNIMDEYIHTADVSLNNYYLSCASEEISFSKCLSIINPYLAPQFICDIRLRGTIYHPMKVYNIPGQGDLL